MASSTYVHCVFHPPFGPDWQTGFHIRGLVVNPNDTTLQLILAKINAVTASVCVEISLSVVHDAVATAATGVAYRNVDKAFFPATDEHGKSHGYRIPSPKPAIISTGDNESIDMTAGTVVAYVSAVTTYAKTPGGDAVTHLLHGRRTENRKPLKTAGTTV